MLLTPKVVAMYLLRAREVHSEVLQHSAWGKRRNININENDDTEILTKKKYLVNRLSFHDFGKFEINSRIGSAKMCTMSAFL